MAQADFTFSTAYLGTPVEGSAVAHATLTNPLTSAAEQNCRYWADDGSGNRQDAPKGFFAKCEKAAVLSVANTHAISVRGWFRVPVATADNTVLGLRVKGVGSSGVSGYNFFLYQNKLYSELTPNGLSGMVVDGDLVVAAAADQWHRIRMDVIPVMHEGAVVMDRVRLFTWNADTLTWTLRGERYYEATDADFLPWGDATYKYNGFFMHNAQSGGLVSYASGYVDDFEIRLEETATSARGVTGIVTPEAPPVEPFTIVDNETFLYNRSPGEFANFNAFAALKDDGSVVTWGVSTSGGSSTAVAAELSSGVKQVYSTLYAFAALKQDGSVVAWGDETWGGSAPAGLSDAAKIFSSSGAFAAVKNDGSVVTWGNSARGGDSSAVSAQLTSGVLRIYSNQQAFAALKDDGTVAAWGNSTTGGTAPAGLSDVVEIQATDLAFAARKSDGTVVAWGSSTYGGTAPEGLSDVAVLYSNVNSFVALKNDTSIVGWGNSSYGGTGPAVTGVVNIVSTPRAFAALFLDGSVRAWGWPASGGDHSPVLAQLNSGVTAIYGNEVAFAAVKLDGSVVTWGTATDGGDSSAVAAQLSSGVVKVVGSQRAFAALKDDGSVVTWGNATYGADSSAVAAQISSGVTKLFSVYNAFAALKSDGSIVTWGGGSYSVSAGVLSSLSSNVLYVATPLTDDQFNG